MSKHTPVSVVMTASVALARNEALAKELKLRRFRNAVPEPMKVIKDRQEDVLKLPAFKAPKHSFSDQLSIHSAARAHAEWDNSDPFAYGRAVMLMLRGIEHHAKLGAEARSHLRAKARMQQLKEAQRAADEAKAKEGA